MNKFNLLLGIGAVALFSACSNDEPNPAPAPIEDGSRAFMTVQLNGANIGSRAIEDINNDGYLEGDPDEHTITSADFYFFEENGAYVGKSTIWHDDQASTGNVEWKGKTTIVLENLKSNQYPKYMMTVLNAPGFQPANTLEATARSLQAWSDNGFVMSTSSFFNSTDTKHYTNTYPYVNVLDEGDFQVYPAGTTPSVDDNTPVIQVYVERLKAKVMVDVTAKETLEKDGQLLFKVESTLAGGDNPEQGPGIAGTDIYVRIDGWALTGTNQQSYLSKQLKGSWADTDVFTDWNNQKDYRSFWGMSYLYTDAATADAAMSKADLTDKLKFIAPAAATNTVGTKTLKSDFQYCYELTNSVFNQTSNGVIDPSKVTSVLLKATAVDKDNKPLDLVQFQGLLYTFNRYKDMVMGRLAAQKQLPYYYQTTDAEGNLKYVQVDGKWLNIEQAAAGDGKHIKVVVRDLVDNEFKDAEGNVLPSLYYSTDEETFTPVDNASFKNAVAANLAAAQSTPAIGFNKGANIYRVPIRHLVPLATGENAAIVEGNYGVVRNHIYQVNISQIMRLGEGVFNPNEVIIPDGPDEEEQFFVAAQVNVLSWKIVENNYPI